MTKTWNPTTGFRVFFRQTLILTWTKKNVSSQRMKCLRSIQSYLIVIFLFLLHHFTTQSIIAGLLFNIACVSVCLYKYEWINVEKTWNHCGHHSLLTFEFFLYKATKHEVWQNITTILLSFFELLKFQSFLTYSQWNSLRVKRKKLWNLLQ